MNCPFCGGAMKRGTLSTDSRTLLRWNGEGESRGLLEVISGKGIIKNAKMVNNRCELVSYICNRCGKLVADVRVEKI